MFGLPCHQSTLRCWSNSSCMVRPRCSATFSASPGLNQPGLCLHADLHVLHAHSFVSLIGMLSVEEGVEQVGAECMKLSSCPLCLPVSPPSITGGVGFEPTMPYGGGFTMYSAVHFDVWERLGPGPTAVVAAPLGSTRRTTFPKVIDKKLKEYLTLCFQYTTPHYWGGRIRTSSNGTQCDVIFLGIRPCASGWI